MVGVTVKEYVNIVSNSDRFNLWSAFALVCFGLRIQKDNFALNIKSVQLLKDSARLAAQWLITFPLINNWAAYRE